MASGAHYNTLPAIFGFTDPTYSNPRLATIIQAVIAIIFALTLNIGYLIPYFAYAELLDRITVLTAFLFMRYKKVQFADKAYQNPLIVLLAYYVVVLALLVIPVISVSGTSGILTI